MAIEETHTLVLGAGTAGATLAGILAEYGTESVVLVEAGPDYGDFFSGRWPGALSDAGRIPDCHDWPVETGQTAPFPIARVMGGCSTHNGCTVAVGSAEDYDEWVSMGNPGWSAEEVRPLFEMLLSRFRVRVLDPDELTPIQAAFVAAGVGSGLPYAADLDRMEAGVGVGPMAANVSDGVRWNSGFAFVDQVRDQSNFDVLDETHVEEILTEEGRAVGARVTDGDGTRVIRAERTIVSSGAIGSPALLQRSRIGSSAVGRNLLDHPCLRIDFAGSDLFDLSLSETAYHPDEQALGRAKSSWCDAGPYDIHVWLVAGRQGDGSNVPPISLCCGAMKARSQGSVDLGSSFSTRQTKIDPAYLSDPDGHDANVLTEALHLLRGIASSSELSPFLGREVTKHEDAVVPDSIATYCHPAGTCKMGPAGDPTAVVDSEGRVHGYENLYVADASIMPTITRGNTNIPTAMIGARVACGLLGKEPGDIV